MLRKINSINLLYYNSINIYFFYVLLKHLCIIKIIIVICNLVGHMMKNIINTENVYNGLIFFGHPVYIRIYV